MDTITTAAPNNSLRERMLQDMTIRLEITTPTDPDWNHHTDRGRAHLAWWSEGKRRAVEKGEDVAEAMIHLIQSRNGLEKGAADTWP